VVDPFLTVRTTQDAIVASLQEPSLDSEAAAEKLRTELLGVVQNQQPRLLLIDFSRIKIIASSAIGALLAVRSKLLDINGELRLCAVSPPIREIYRTLNLEGTMFPVFDTVDQALRAPITSRNDA
jgi:anti-anti-sigma factor